MLKSTYCLSKTDRHQRWGILGLCSAPLLGSYLYKQGHTVPFLGCPLRHFTGIPCPTCGMTRSFVAIVQGDWHHAVDHHLFGPLLFLIFVIAVVHITVELLTQKPLTTVFTRLLRIRKVQFWGLLMYCGYYLLRLSYLAFSGQLSTAFLQSPLGSIFNL